MKWSWPLLGADRLTSYQGDFGAIRKYDIHTGVDCYCEPGQLFAAVEDGIVVAIEDFTGEFANPPSPWWHNTKSILIEGASGVVVYGEVQPLSYITVGKKVKRGKILGTVITVLKKDKGMPMTMLHVELYEKGIRETMIWNLEEPQPAGLLNPMPILNYAV